MSNAAEMHFLQEGSVNLCTALICVGLLPPCCEAVFVQCTVMSGLPRPFVHECLRNLIKSFVGRKPVKSKPFQFFKPFLVSIWVLQLVPCKQLLCVHVCYTQLKGNLRKISACFIIKQFLKELLNIVCNADFQYIIVVQSISVICATFLKVSIKMPFK